ncbi:PDR/VanB family oxidoreductase [Microbacterium lacus]|uniref:PDR/VanB family oxidoreductase n=1 Tax=Microbacterium lacus TaxID=415217 RepID=A0ABN2H065_9MICO
MTVDTNIRRPLGEERSLVCEVTGLELQGSGAIVVLTLAPADGRELPSWTPGAHIDVLMDNGIERQYSLCGDVAPGEPWRIGVLREPQSRGGSEYMHTSVSVGQHLTLQGPRNNFEVVDAPAYQFIAGGIGVTPILPMIRKVEAEGKPWRLMYGGRSSSSMAFLDEISQYDGHVTLWPQDTAGIIPVRDLVSALEPGTAVYCCGPEPLLNAVEDAMSHLPADQLHVERFRPRQDLLEQVRTPFDIVLDYSELELHVPADKTIIEVVEAAGLEVMSSCREGTCGTCETVVLSGSPDHRDSYLTAAEKASNEVMMICCSRSKSPRLVLDL